MPETKINNSSSSRHSEFEKIHSDFLSHYSNDLPLGENRYAAWIKALGLDESRGYREQAESRLGLKESFRWAQFLLQYVKEDPEARYYKVEALFPIETLNGDVFSSDELLQAARTLTCKPSNLNHDWAHMLPEIEIKAAQYEDHVVECLVRILKSSPVCAMIDRGEIVNVSIEGDWTHGIPGKGLVLSGLGWLTKDVLPGVPLTRIIPVEKIIEKLNVSSHKSEQHSIKEQIKEEDEIFCVFCDAPADFFISICQSCFDKADSNLSQVSVAEKELVEHKAKLIEAQNTIAQLNSQISDRSLLKDPPKQVAFSEVEKSVQSVLPSLMVERSWGLGPQRMCQELRRMLMQLEQKAGGN
jgi:hypothetical protein